MNGQLLRTAVAKLVSDGPVELARSTREFVSREYRERRHPFKQRFQISQALFDRHDLNVCYNAQIPEQYDPDEENVLLAIESPAVVEHEEWLDESMTFDAEISFGNFYDLDRYYCPRTLYATNDNFVDLDLSRSYDDKDALVSMVYSGSTHLDGHALRHDVADEFEDRLDLYGSGEGEYTDRFWSEVHNAYLERKASSLSDHRFQVVIENTRHPSYVSEKFFDAVKTHTVPIYWGGRESLAKMGFDEDGILFFETLDDLEQTLSSLSAAQYQEMRPAVERNRERLVEIRDRDRFGFFLNSVKPGYMHSVESYHKRAYDDLRIGFDD